MKSFKHDFWENLKYKISNIQILKHIYFCNVFRVRTGLYLSFSVSICFIKVFLFIVVPINVPKPLEKGLTVFRNRRKY